MHRNIKKAQWTVNPQLAMGAFWMAAGLRRSCKAPRRGRGARRSSTRWPRRQPASSQQKLSDGPASQSCFRPVVSTPCSSTLSSWEGWLAPAPYHRSSEHRLGTIAALGLIRSYRSKVPRSTAQRRFSGCTRNEPGSVVDRSELRLTSPAWFQLSLQSHLDPHNMSIILDFFITQSIPVPYYVW